MNIAIIGSSSGIGAGLARYFAKRGHSIWITYHRSRSQAEELHKNLEEASPSVNYFISHLDILNYQSVISLVAEVTEKMQQLDLLIICAGADYYDSHIEALSVQAWQEIFNIKTDGAFLITQALIPLLKKAERSNIVFLSASVATKPDWRDPAYSSASAAINNFAQSMAIALSSYGIRSNVVCPGPIKTNLKYWQEAEKANPLIWQQMSKENPLNRLCSFEDIGSLIRYVCEEGTYLNGNIFYLNGGHHLK
jgi:NAD(P)-dependent dehydrogenase (short-subunit alcohol dehydrogenase family)